MSNDKKIYCINKDIATNIEYLSIKINSLKKKEQKLQDTCDHTIVVKIPDTKEYNTGIIDHFFCPACSKVIKQFNNDLNDLSFNKSQIITINSINLKEHPDVQETIEEEIFKDYDYYYNLDIDPGFKANAINTCLEEKTKKKGL